MTLDEEMKFMRLIQSFVACLSCVGEVFVIFCYIIFIQRKTFRIKLIVCLMTANFIATVADLMVFANKNHYVCIVEGFLRSCGEVSAMMWVIVISQISYKEIMEPKYNKKGRLRKAMYLAAVFPVSFSLIPLFGNFTGLYRGYSSDATLGLTWCSADNTYWILNRYPIMVIGFILTFRQYYKIHMHIKAQLEQISAATQSLTKLYIYPTILFVSWFPAMVDRSLLSFGIRFFPLLILHIVGVRSMGFTNAVFYGYSQREAFSEGFQRLTFTPKKRDSQQIIHDENNEDERGIDDFEGSETGYVRTEQPIEIEMREFDSIELTKALLSQRNFFFAHSLYFL